MKPRVASAVLQASLLVCALFLTFNMHSVSASSTIYIRPDGSVDPSTVSIHKDGDIFTLTGNINSTIVIEKDNIVFDGEGHAVKSPTRFPSAEPGIRLSGRKNVTIRNTQIENFRHGILLDNSSNNSIKGNTVTHAPEAGILLRNSSNNNSIQGNTMTGSNLYTSCGFGIWLNSSSNHNSAYGNTVENGTFGIALWDSSYSDISGNTLTNNEQGIIIDSLSSNDSICSNSITAISLIEDNWGIYYIDYSIIGIHVWSSRSHNISENTITNSTTGISLFQSSNTTIWKNDIMGSPDSGIRIWGSNYNNISGNNTITNSRRGIWLIDSFNNSIIANSITNNDYGIAVEHSSDNSFYDNNLVDNSQQVTFIALDCANRWDNGREGNYWSDYTGIDNSSPPDGIGDTPYIVNSYNRDNYPLMTPYYLQLLVGDTNHDLKVDIKDLAIAATAFGSYPGNPKWNPVADVNQDGKIDMKDLVLIAKNFGRTQP